MKVKELKEILDNMHGHHLEQEVIVRLDEPSIGPIASTKVKNAYMGFDWDRDFILTTEEKISRKSDLQSLFEHSKEFLMTLASANFYEKKVNNIHKKALRIVLKIYDIEHLSKYSRFYSNGQEKIRTDEEVLALLEK